VERAIALAGELQTEPAPPEYDLLSGSAGAILGLLALCEISGNSTFIEIAARLADVLIEAADRRDKEWSWKAHCYRFARNLTGFSHGAAGIGCALLELYAATGESLYRAAAEGAFTYERSSFDPTEGNWPDFRYGNAARDSSQTKSHSFATFWCHGAPGIALSRIRARELLGDERYEAEARTALDTTRKWLERALHSGSGNYSLCHGLTGNAEVLMLSRDGKEERGLALRVAAAGRMDAETHNGMWSCGTGGGETPGLMLGLAGIGLFYLRLHSSSTPTVLLMPSRGWW
jgi:lantibiotic modifying enzyme